VDLPAPEAPNRQNISPSLQLKLTSSRAIFFPKVFVIFCNSRLAILAFPQFSISSSKKTFCHFQRKEVNVFLIEFHIDRLANFRANITKHLR
jgi:hypothetical protein